MEAVALNKVYEFELPTSDLISPEQSMRVSMARTGKKSFAKSIFYCWNNLEDASRSLARTISHSFPNKAGNGFLLDEAIAAACAAYEHQASVSQRDTKAMSAFLETLLDVATEGLIDWRVHGVLASSESLAWPTISMPIFEWVKKKHVEKIVFTRRDVGDVQHEERRATRILLTSAILTLNDVINVTRDHGE